MVAEATIPAPEVGLRKESQKMRIRPPDSSSSLVSLFPQHVGTGKGTSLVAIRELLKTMQSSIFFQEPIQSDCSQANEPRLPFQGITRGLLNDLLIWWLLWHQAMTEFRVAQGSIAEDKLLKEGLARFSLRRLDNQTPRSMPQSSQQSECCLSIESSSKLPSHPALSAKIGWVHCVFVSS